MVEFQKETEQREYVPCPAKGDHKGHLRRSGILHHFVKHDDRNERMIWGWDVAVHDAIIEKFQKEGFTGFRTEPALVTFQDGRTSDEYKELVVTGWAGVARPESGIRLLESCETCGWKNYGPVTDFQKVIDWDKWTGEDFFFVWPLMANRLCTERVGRWLLDQRVRSFQLGNGFELLEQRKNRLGYGIPRGPLSNYLPLDLAIKYGRPLGLE